MDNLEELDCLQTENGELRTQLELCLKDMESKDLGMIENRIEEVKHTLKNLI